MPELPGRLGCGRAGRLREDRCAPPQPMERERLDGRDAGATVTCPTCQAVIEIDGTQFDREFKKAERELKDFGKRISRGR